MTAPSSDPLSATTMVGALNLALQHEMERDEKVVIFGEDVGKLGGVFRVTEGLQERFGALRCFDTPIAEAGILGMAIGMAFQGYRPVVEMQFDAFGYPAFEQLVSHLAKLRNRTRGAVSMPVVVRVPYGGGVGAVEHHSDSSEAFAAHVPGLHVYTPSTVADAYAMMRAAIRSDDPVVFYEPKKLYWKAADLDVGQLVQAPGTAVVRREGVDLTLISYGPSMVPALAAADAAAEAGYDVGVVDLRTLVPFDEDTVCDVVMSTGRAIVVHEAGEFQGIGAEIATRVTERCFAYLEGPIRRVAGLDIPYPPPLLEHHHLPTVNRILQTIGDLYSDND
jgi:2-oxoisovalerate dehydrogenase E1 component beta subunit